MLVRNKERGARLASQYPNARVVAGDLDSASVIEEEVKNADIVYRAYSPDRRLRPAANVTTDFADCDHVAAANAVAKGLSHHTPQNPVWLIHTSGTGILTFEDIRASSYGIERAKEYNDWDGINEVTSIPDDALHRNVDKIILEAGLRAPDSIKTAIVCPPTIYGPGRGPGNQKSVQAYLFTDAVLKRKRGFLVGQGKNVWHQIHVQDLSNVYLALGEAAAAGGGQATWGDQGYYFAENGSFVWGDVQRAIAKAAFEKKLIPSPEAEPLPDAKVAELNPRGLYAWGSNSRGHAVRARKLLGWAPQKPSLLELIPHIVDVEAKDLGLM